jgi:hypothetical protein
MTCPKCKLLNPDSALRCDCGYDFQTRTIQESSLKAAPKKRVWSETYWPTIADQGSAASAARKGAAVAFWVAGLTGFFATLALFDVFRFVEPTAFLDVGIFLAIGVGVRVKYSRIAAVAGLLLYLVEVAWRLVNPPLETSRPVNVMTVIFVLFFINGVRGAFAYQKFRKMPSAERIVGACGPPSLEAWITPDTCPGSF